MTYINVTKAGLAAGLSPERINRILERRARQIAMQTITLPPSEYWQDDDWTPPTGAPAAPARGVV